MQKRRTKVAIIGYSGHALVVVETLHQAGFEITGYFEKRKVPTNPLKLKYLGYEREIGTFHKLSKYLLFPAIGDNAVRKEILIFLKENNLNIVTAISPKSNISIYATIGYGTLVCPGACINPFVSIGKGVIINTSAIIEHECIIGDYTHIAPGAVLVGNVQVGECSFVGANAIVKQGIKIGNNAVIGAGAVILQDVNDNEIWVGNPGRKQKDSSN